jgi:hypothetical protein
MKKIIGIAFLAISTSVQALYNGNPALPRIPEEGFYLAKEAWMAIRIGYEGDYVFNRKMNHHVHEFKILENFGTATFTFFDRLDLYASGGSFCAKIRQQDETRLEFETNSAPTWKVGSRLILWEYGETYLTFNFGYMQAYSRIKDISQNAVPLERNNAKLFYHEIEGGLGVAHHIDIFIPYLGIEASRAWAKLKNLGAVGIGHLNIHSRNPVGVFLGCGLSPGCKVILNVEVRLVDEQAISLSGDLRF